MSELARITAHYLAVLLDRAGMSASIPDMRAELEAAAEKDASDEERARGAAAIAAVETARGIRS